MNWLHRLFNPHCPDCIDQGTNVNTVVEELRTELASLRYERDRLLKYILDTPKSINEVEVPQEEMPEPIVPKFVPWHMRRQLLETEDRKKAELLKQSKQDQDNAIAELEKNLGIIKDKVLEVGGEDVQSEPVKVNE